jgi:hypothetical protein
MPVERMGCSIKTAAREESKQRRSSRTICVRPEPPELASVFSFFESISPLMIVIGLLDFLPFGSDDEKRSRAQ